MKIFQLFVSSLAMNVVNGASLRKRTSNDNDTPQRELKPNPVSGMERDYLENYDVPYHMCDYHIWNKDVLLNNQASTCGALIKNKMTDGSGNTVVNPREACRWVRDMNFDRDGSCDCSCETPKGLCDPDIWDRAVTKKGKKATCGARIEWMQTEEAKEIHGKDRVLTEREACQHVRDEGFDDGTCDCLCFDAEKEIDCPERPKVDKDANMKDLVKDCTTPTAKECPTYLWGHPMNCWDMSEVTDLSSAFADSNFDEPLNLWNVSSVTSMKEMFYRNRKFDKPIGNWNVENVRRMDGMFRSTEFNQRIGLWKTGSVTDMSNMFEDSKFNMPIRKWKTSSVTNMHRMFFESHFNQPIGDWDVPSVEYMGGMFELSKEFDQPLENWATISVRDMSTMFKKSEKFNQPIEFWETKDVTNMGGMFLGSQFDKPIGYWSVKSVKTMESMFEDSKFNQPIENWLVENWDGHSVKNMHNMFYNSSFNQPIGQWDTRSVTDMSNMFGMSSFNQVDILMKWNVPEAMEDILAGSELMNHVHEFLDSYHGESE